MVKDYIKKDIEFSGNFVDVLLEGEGKSENKNREIYKGNFKKGERNGKGVSNFANGDIYMKENLKIIKLQEKAIKNGKMEKIILESL